MCTSEEGGAAPEDRPSCGYEPWTMPSTLQKADGR